ncbi:hypothetical protein OC846_003716 [Tilletia horrida]|uniref:Copper transporter n=1 Tax=Tilletia horrida TaxID=155126 RepID=A0AAN6GUC7_9BASI|nr:hypothetical protein OC846_003716 [Tilletia horrida]KAK0551942.1 hypothetical protein OC845_001915 [Tilletia horrida]KAK0565450.1 hypothetical protein OC861_003748 [Tilletia horrida]
MSSTVDAPRCPLGFTGTPPAGHPTIPGLGSASKAGSSSSGQSRPSIQAFINNLLSQPWSNTHTMLVIDALVIIAATVIVLNWERLGFGKAGAASSSSPSAAQVKRSTS